MLIKADLHVHSRFSEDCRTEMGAVCEAAIAKGLECIAFTDHLDLNPADRGYGFFDYSGFSAALDQARRKYGDRIQILKGVEFGEPHRYPADFERITKLDFDLILGSVHFIEETFVGESKIREWYGVAELFERYYEQVYEAVNHGGFDILAHIDFPKRYHGNGEVQHLTREIFGAMVKQGIGLEINTSPVRKGLNECSPGVALLQQYVAAGGSKVTIGSDAHRADDLGADFNVAASMMTQVEKAQPGILVKRQFVALYKAETVCLKGDKHSFKP